MINDSNYRYPVTEPTSPKHTANASTVHGGDTSRTKGVTEVWHADATWIAEPPVGTGLRLVKVPPVGGDTCWTNVTLAYDDLIAPLRDMLDQLEAVHWSIPSLDAMGIGPQTKNIQYVQAHALMRKASDETANTWRDLESHYWHS